MPLAFPRFYGSLTGSTSRDNSPRSVTRAPVRRSVTEMFRKRTLIPLLSECQGWVHPTCDILAIPRPVPRRSCSTSPCKVNMWKVIDPDESEREKTKNTWIYVQYMCNAVVSYALSALRVSTFEMRKTSSSSSIRIFTSRYEYKSSSSHESLSSYKPVCYFIDRSDISTRSDAADCFFLRSQDSGLPDLTDTFDPCIPSLQSCALWDTKRKQLP